VRAADLVRDLRARGVDLWAADGSSLRYRGPKEVLEPALADLKARRPDVLRLLTQLVATQEAAELCLDWLRSVPQVALDIETYATPEKYRGLYTLGRPRLLSFAHGTTVRSVDIAAVDLGIVKQMLEAIVEKTKFLHHATFDLPRLYRLTGILLTDNIHDTMIASKTARAGEWTDWGKPKEHSLDDVIERELGVKIPKDRKMKWSADLTEAHLEYAADDVIYLENLHEVLRKVLVDHSVLDRYEAVRATLPTFLRAAVRGVPVDTRRLEELIAASAAEEDRLLAEVRTFEPDHPDDGQWVWKNKNKKDKVDRWGNRIGRNGALRALSLLGVDLPNLETDSTLVDYREDHLLVPVLRDYYKAADEHSHYQK
jgi:3'-5' exonuclease/TubC N-terminal docking domain